MPGGGTVGLGVEGAVLLEQGQGIGGGQFAQNQPVAPGGWQPARGGQQVQPWPQGGQAVGLFRADHPRVGDVVQDQQDVAQPGEALAQAAGHGGEVGRGLLAFLVADAGADFVEVAQAEHSLAQAGLPLARDEEASAGIRAGKRVRVGEGQLGLANPAQALHPAHDAGLVVLEPLAQFKQFVEPAREELLVVGRNGGFAAGGGSDELRMVVEVPGQDFKHAVQVIAAEGVHAFVGEGFDEIGKKLATAHLLDDRGGGGEEAGVRHGQVAQLGDPLGDGLLSQRPLAGEAGHFNEVNRAHAFGEDVLGDFSINPRPPFLATPVAGEVIRRDEGEEEARVGDAMIQRVFPIASWTNGLLVEELMQRSARKEFSVLSEQFVNEVGNPAGGIVIAGVGDEEVVVGMVGMVGGHGNYEFIGSR